MRPGAAHQAAAVSGRSRQLMKGGRMVSAFLRACSTWWHALSQAQAAAAVSLYHDIAFFEARTWTLELLDMFFTTCFEPHRVISVLETLVTEGLLSRLEGSVLQEAALRQTDAR